MELRRLTYFLAVADELHFGRAASRLGIAQPPLSRQIAALEADIGAQLFDRSRSQIRLTQETRLVGAGGAGRLRVAFVGSASHGVLPSLIKSYRSHFPNVELALSAMNNAALHSALVQREIDIAVARPELKDEELRHVPLEREPLILAVPDNSELATRETIQFAELGDQAFVLYPRRPRPSYADFVLNLCGQANFEPAALELAQDYQTAISLVSVGVGISVVPESVSRTTRPGVFFRPYEGPNPGTGLTIHARRDNQSRQVQHFLDVAQRFVRAR